MLRVDRCWPVAVTVMALAGCASSAAAQAQSAGRAQPEARAQGRAQAQAQPQAQAHSSPQGVSDSAAVIAVVQRLFDAMAARDTATARALMLPGARVISLRAGQNTVPRVQSDSAFVRQLAPGGQPLLERMWNPLVRVHGRLAEVWTPYDFHSAGRFSHCGVDSFTLVRGPDGWLVANIAYTVEPTGCAPSPLGPPK